MTQVKKWLMQFPEGYLILLVFLAAYTPPFYFNPIFILVIAILLAQIAFKNKASGLIIASFFLVINVVMLGPLFSELHEFTEFNSDAKQLLFGGLLIWSINMMFSGLMILKYLNMGHVSNSKTSIHSEVLLPTKTDSF